MSIPSEVSNTTQVYSDPTAAGSNSRTQKQAQNKDTRQADVSSQAEDSETWFEPRACRPHPSPLSGQVLPVGTCVASVSMCTGCCRDQRPHQCSSEALPRRRPLLPESRRDNSSHFLLPVSLPGAIALRPELHRCLDQTHQQRRPAPEDKSSRTGSLFQDRTLARH